MLHNMLQLLHPIFWRWNY